MAKAALGVPGVAEGCGGAALVKVVVTGNPDARSAAGSAARWLGWAGVVEVTSAGSGPSAMMRGGPEMFGVPGATSGVGTGPDSESATGDAARWLGWAGASATGAGSDSGERALGANPVVVTGNPDNGSAAGGAARWLG